MCRRWRLWSPPTSYRPLQGTPAPTIALLADLLEQSTCLLLTGLPALGQIREAGVHNTRAAIRYPNQVRGVARETVRKYVRAGGGRHRSAPPAPNARVPGVRPGAGWSWTQPVRRPRDKPHVERLVQYVRGCFWKGSSFVPWVSALGEFLIVDWGDVGTVPTAAGERNCCASALSSAGAAGSTYASSPRSASPCSSRAWRAASTRWVVCRHPCFR
jgi:hypothetical protein